MEALEGSGRLAGRAEHGRGLPGQGALSVVTQALTANSAAASCAFPTFPSGMLPEVALTPGVSSSWLGEPAWGKPSRSTPPPPQVTLKRLGTTPAGCQAWLGLRVGGLHAGVTGD